jgi:hypothetical protein
MEILFILLFYFLPTFNAFMRDHPNIGAIAVINIFLGWTFIGWVVALAWSASAVDRTKKPDRHTGWPYFKKEEDFKKKEAGIKQGESGEHESF